MTAKNFLLVLILVHVLASSILGQSKRDYQWIIGYDTSLLVAGGDAILMDFNFCPINPINVPSVHDFWMEGSNTSMSDEEGNLLFYSNGCYIVNKMGEIMENGDSINPGLVQDIYCSAGGSPYVQGVLSIPAPGSDSLYYVFNLDMDLPYWLQDPFLGVAPQRLYYQVIDMSQDNGLGKVVAKNQVAIQDTFARANIQAVRHANGVDWWVITAKSHSNCYFITHVTEQGVQTNTLECVGKVWSDHDGSGQALFTPAANKYIRFNSDNGLNIFDFDNETGSLSNPTVIEFPNDTFSHGGAAISSNSRFLYISARTNLYQFDLQAADIAASKTLIGVWDGFADPYPTIFYLAALAPNNKIYISSTSSHKYLHVIHKPDSLGLACEFEQRGVKLPSYNYATIPNFPHYRSQPTPMDCDSLVSSKEIVPTKDEIKTYPNPTKGMVTIELNQINSNALIEVYDMFGRKRLAKPLEHHIEQLDMTSFEEGMYIIIVKPAGKMTINEKLIKIE